MRKNRVFVYKAREQEIVHERGSQRWAPKIEDTPPSAWVWGDVLSERKPKCPQRGGGGVTFPFSIDREKNLVDLRW